MVVAAVAAVVVMLECLPCLQTPNQQHPARCRVWCGVVVWCVLWCGDGGGGGGGGGGCGSSAPGTNVCHGQLVVLVQSLPDDAALLATLGLVWSGMFGVECR